MTKLTDSEFKLYKTCFDGINKRYEEFNKYDNQIIKLLNGEFSKLETENLVTFLDMIGYSESRILIIQELQNRYSLIENQNKPNQ